MYILNSRQVLVDLNSQGIDRSRCLDAIRRSLTIAQRLLDHLHEAAFYSAKDLDSINTTCERMRETLERGKDTYSPHLLTLLQNRLDKCQVTLSELQKPLANLSPELTPIHEKLVSILRSMAAANTRNKVDKSQYGPQHSVDSHWVVPCFRS